MVKMSAPYMASSGHVKPELGLYTDGSATLRTLPSITYKFLGDLFEVDSLALVDEGRVSCDHERNSAQLRQRSDDIRGMPSEKYSCSGSPLMSVRGSTAMAGRSIPGSTAGGFDPAARRWHWPVRCRSSAPHRQSADPYARHGADQLLARRRYHRSLSARH